MHHLQGLRQVTLHHGEDDLSESSTHVLAISGQHVAVLAAMIYVVLRLFAVPMLLRNSATLGLVWLYIFVAGAPPSAIRAGMVATFVLAAPIFGRQLSPLHCTNGQRPTCAILPQAGPEAGD
ncbi:MAG: ComEC/Rec2 family competence protein [Actinobacteria bacterium]|nr:ComEC/Rec2 family competence protein [Actinomycetota bacterium]